MVKKAYIVFQFLLCFGFLQAQELFERPKGESSHWSTFENPRAVKSSGAMENRGAKGHAFEVLLPGETKVLLDENNPGVIRRIWLTINNFTPAVIRSIRIEMYWDNAQKPAVSVPLGDFFNEGSGRKIPFESSLFADPEGRSYLCNIPMPYKKAAKIVLINDSPASMRLFYDIAFTRTKKTKGDMLYFHAFWSRSLKNELGKDFVALPLVNGCGRFLGMNLSVISNPDYGNTWWGEGEMKIYIDGDTDYPTLAGTGIEDYIGTAWELGVFAHQHQGCLVSDKQLGQYFIYRFHVNDPVYFSKNCRVQIQAMGSAPYDEVMKLSKDNVPLIPVSVNSRNGYLKLLDKKEPIKIDAPDFPKGRVFFYRQDDYASTAYFYLDKPTTDLPAIGDVPARVAKLPESYQKTTKNEEPKLN